MSERGWLENLREVADRLREIQKMVAESTAQRSVVERVGAVAKAAEGCVLWCDEHSRRC